MKKLTFILCIAMLFCSLMPVTVLAEATALEDHLVRHYNFYDCVNTTRPKDVTYTGTGTKYSFYAPTGVTTQNGLGYVPTGSSYYYSCGDTDDITGLSDMTVFLAFKPEGTAAGSFEYALKMYGLLNVYITSAGLHARTDDSKQMIVDSTGATTPYSVTMGDYIMMAISLDWSDDQTKVTSNVYISNDGGKTYATYSAVLATAKNPSTFTKMTLGESSGTTSKVNYFFDDLRIYDKALTQSEITDIKLDKSPSVAPHHISMQSRTNSGNYDVRFCAALDHLNYSEVGFEIIATDADGNELERFDHAANSVYESVLALGEPVTANDICEGSKYLIAYAVLEIPDNLGTLIFHVRSYGTDANGTFYSDTVTFTFNGSNYVAG